MRLTACIIAVLIAALGLRMFVADRFTLGTVHDDIVERYVGVRHIDGAALEAMAPETLLLFDVRETDEFSVSHLRGAHRLDPGGGAAALKTFAGDVRGKTVVFYCSVGHRSSAKALELADALGADGAAAVFNLKGGIFQWRNERRPLERDGESTESVHPYNQRWGQLIDDDTAIRYSVDEAR